jgi:hypothetical protein
MIGSPKLTIRSGWVLAALLLAAGTLSAGAELLAPQFKYAAGTEDLPEDCEGNLELTQEGMGFRYEGGVISIPFASITRMQYRSDVSPKISRLKVMWKIRPPFSVSIPFIRPKQYRYFAVAYRVDNSTHVLVLRVPPGVMRPYLAEIDLKAHRRVEVENLEDY